MCRMGSKGLLSLLVFWNPPARGAFATHCSCHLKVQWCCLADPMYRLLCFPYPQESNDRSLLKNLGSWLGLLTFARNKPVLIRELDIKQVCRWESSAVPAVLWFLSCSFPGSLLTSPLVSGTDTVVTCGHTCLAVGSSKCQHEAILCVWLAPFTMMVSSV
jgi:hypothetical protein